MPVAGIAAPITDGVGAEREPRLLHRLGQDDPLQGGARRGRVRGVAPRAAEALSKSRAALGKILAPSNEGGDEPPSSGWRGRLGAKAPLILLALALAVALLLNFNREHYYARLEWDTAKNLAIAENLSPAHNFRLFLRLTPGEDGEPFQILYSRFPVGSYALIKLVILPFGDNLAAKVFAARMLMLAFLVAAAFLAYHSILRISSNQWIALAATLTAFSSYYILRYHDQVSNEFTMELFALMLTFHGMIIFLQEGRFRQLVVKTCIALLIGWRVYSLLGPFIVLGLGSELIAAINARRGAGSDPSQASAPSSALCALTRSRYLRLGVVAVMFGAALLSFNVIQEYDATGGQTPLRELPSVDSIMNRVGWGALLGVDDGDWRVIDAIDWEVFLRRQFYRVAGSAIPEALINWRGFSMEALPNGPPLRYVAAGIILTAGALGGLLFTRRRMLLFTLAASGFIWTLATPGQTYLWEHQHAAIFYIGVPLTLVTLLLLAARGLGARILLPAAAVAAFAVFTLSASQSIASRPDAVRVAARQQAVFSDMSRIRQRIPVGKSVFVAQSEDSREERYGATNAADFYLSGSRIRYPSEAPANQAYDYVVIPHRDESFPLLTPHNEAVFLYERAAPADLERSWVDSVASGASSEPAARSVYDVFIADGALVFVKEPCVAADIALRFFLHVFPEDPDDLPAWRREHGYDNLDFAFPLRGVSFEDRCAASVPLPQYAISSVRTGQFGRGEGKPWRVSLRLDADALRTAYATATSREPDVAGEFDLYLDEEEGTLTYVKEPCAASDVDAPIFLHVTPERVDDLPEDRRGFGFDNKDFDFLLNGVVFDGKCVARVPLPGYRIASIRTGSGFSGEGEAWKSTISFGG